jgi:DDE superfamily endonuclease
MERDEWQRAAWRVMLAQWLDARSLVFVDEMGTNTSLSPIYGWAKKGERAHCSVPRLFQGKNTTVLSSMSVEGMGQSLAVEGATNSQVFETYVERVLAPSLRKGQVVIMDNLSAHKGERVKELFRSSEVASCCTCRPTHQTLTPSRRHSAR